ILLLLHSFPTRRSSDLIFFLYSSVFLTAAFPLSLSAFVKTIEKGIPLSPHHCIKSRSICCGECRISIKTKRFTRLVLLRIYCVRSEEHTSELQSRENLV